MIITILLVIIIAVGTVFVLKAVHNNTSNNNDSQKTSASIKTTADNLKAQAVTDLKNNNTAKAKTLFEQAQQQYKSIDDTNGVVDTQAQLYMIEHGK